MKILILLTLVFTSVILDAKVSSRGNPSAPKVGTFYYHLSSFPTTLNPLSSTDYYASQVQSFILDSLAIRDPDNYKWVPSLAESWEISKDGKSFDFVIRSGVKCMMVMN